MVSNIDGIVEKLRQEQERIRSQYDVARRGLVDLEQELQKVDDALAVLEGERGEAAAPPRRRKRTGGKEKLGGPQVSAYLVKIIEEEGPQTDEDILNLLKERVAESGYSKVGLHLRYRRLLKDGPFAFDGKEWRLDGGRESRIDGSRDLVNRESAQRSG